ncbi:MAG TPA: methyl-accepting chemotaxis protein [Aquabacterium sp.]|nr:methyl-accepting chemotaxis protein [Aquabacterium sp.]
MLQNFRIFPRLMAGFGIVLAGCLVVAALGAWTTRSVQHRASTLGTDIFERAEALSALERALAAREVAVRDVASQDDVTVVMGEIKRFKAAQAKLKQIDEALAARVAGDADAVALIGQLSAVRGEQQKVVEAVLNHALTGNPAEASKTARTGLVPLVDKSAKVLDDLHALFDRRAKDEVAQAQADAQRSTSLVVAVMAVVVLAGGVLAWTMATGIARPLRQAISAAQAITAGDLTHPIDTTGRDEAADMLRALQAMQQSLSRLVGQVRAGVESVSTASGEIAAGNADLSQRTEQQASSLQQTAASMEQLSGTVRSSTDTAQEANRMASSASTAAQRGGEVVSQVVTTMQDISASSKKIADIIGVIDGIAFQTNILALNAAVEAARAGEQGRGFAVVASEVRSLAQRSAEAAKEIKVLIGASVDRVESGARQVQEAGDAMSEIVAQVQRVSQMIGALSDASAEQSAGIGQIGQAVTQLDQVTQQNAALVEQSAAAAESLRDQAVRLTEVVGSFRVATA